MKYILKIFTFIFFSFLCSELFAQNASFPYPSLSGLPQTSSAQTIKEHVDTDTTKHELGIGLGISIANSVFTNDNMYDGIFMPNDVLLRFDYQYRILPVYRMGIGVEIGFLDPLWYLGNTLGQHVNTHVLWTHEFSIYRLNAFEFTVLAGLGYVYGMTNYYCKYGCENLSGKEGYSNGYFEDDIHHGFEFRIGLGFGWRISKLIALKLDLTFNDELYFNIPVYRSSTHQYENEKTRALYTETLLFKTIFNL